MKRILKSKRIIILVIIVAISIVGTIWQSIMVSYEKDKYIMPGDHIDVDTYDAHYYVKGEGDITFVFIGGAGTPCAYTDFYNLQDYLSSYGVTITFDHSGLGWSTKTNSPRTIENLVKELSTIIDAVTKTDIVLICHSLGSLEAIGYAQENPDKVKGIIFLDGGSPEFYSTDSEFSAKVMNRTLAVTRAVGLNRFLGELGILLPIYGEDTRYKNLLGDLQAIDKTMYYRYSGSYSNYINVGCINENAGIVLAGNRLGEIPTLVLSSDSGKEWEQVQVQLSGWSENCQQFTIDNASHYLYWTNYDETVNYIVKFIRENKLCQIK